jgi:hypothetical protein
MASRGKLARVLQRLLTTDEEHDVWMRAMGRGEGVAAAVPDDALKIVMRGAEKEDKTTA